MWGSTMDGSALMDVTSRRDAATEFDTTLQRPPVWLQCAAVVSLAAVVIGMVAVLVHPGPVSGAIFPLALAGIGLTGWAAGERR
jgi:hypothetical protein